MLRKTLLYIVIIIVLGGILLSIKSKKPTIAPPTQQTQTNITPDQNITAENADQVLQRVDSSIDNQINQVDIDLKSLDQIDTSDDDITNINNL